MINQAELPCRNQYLKYPSSLQRQHEIKTLYTFLINAPVLPGNDWSVHAILKEFFLNKNVVNFSTSKAFIFCVSNDAMNN